MNERIRELWDKAATASAAFPSGQNNSWETQVNFMEKFAELIVKECAKVIVNGGYWSGGPLGPKRQCTPPEIAQMIKEHFEVEE